MSRYEFPRATGPIDFAKLCVPYVKPSKCCDCKAPLKKESTAFRCDKCLTKKLGKWGYNGQRPGRPRKGIKTL